MTEVLHHKIHRKRKELGKPDIHSKKWKNFIDRCVYVVASIGIIMTIPQAVKIFAIKDATSVSLISWLSYIASASFWVLYGVAHKEKLIIFINIGWVIVELVVVVGILIYG